MKRPKIVEKRASKRYRKAVRAKDMESALSELGILEPGDEDYVPPSKRRFYPVRTGRARRRKP